MRPGAIDRLVVALSDVPEEREALALLLRRAPFDTAIDAATTAEVSEALDMERSVVRGAWARACTSLVALARRAGVVDLITTSMADTGGVTTMGRLADQVATVAPDQLAEPSIAFALVRACVEGEAVQIRTRRCGRVVVLALPGLEDVLDEVVAFREVTQMALDSQPTVDGPFLKTSADLYDLEHVCDLPDAVLLEFASSLDQAWDVRAGRLVDRYFSSTSSPAEAAAESGDADAVFTFIAESTREEGTPAGDPSDALDERHDDGPLLAADDDDRQPARLGRVALSSHCVNDLVRRSSTAAPLLSADEEVDLAVRAEAGALAGAALTELLAYAYDTRTRDELEEVEERGRQAVDRLVLSNVRLVVSLAVRYQGRGMELADLVQEGLLGLMRAVAKYDYTRGYKISTYATWWIKQSIGRALADQQRTIRVPVHMVEKVNKVRSAKRLLASRGLDEPDDTQLAELTGLKVDEVRAADRADLTTEPLSRRYWVWVDEAPLDADLRDGRAAATMSSLLVEDLYPETGADELADRGFLARRVRDTLGRLSEREDYIITRRFGLDGGEPATLDAIGREVGVTRERVRQIEKQTIDVLRTELASWHRSTSDGHEHQPGPVIRPSSHVPRPRTS